MEKKEKKKQNTRSILSDSLTRRMLKQYLTPIQLDDREKKTIQIDTEAIALFKKDLLEITRWIAVESEKLAVARRSNSRITAEDIRRSVKTYLRRE